MPKLLITFAIMVLISIVLGAIVLSFAISRVRDEAEAERGRVAVDQEMAVSEAF